MAATLAEALGLPPSGRLLPTRRSPEWQATARVIEEWIGVNGLLTGRTVTWVWVKLQHTTPAKRGTWGQLIAGWEDASATDVATALRATSRAPSLTIASWNVRWLVRADAAHVRAKKEVIEQRLLRGRLCACKRPIGSSTRLRSGNSGSSCGTCFGLRRTGALVDTVALGALPSSCQWVMLLTGRVTSLWLKDTQSGNCTL